MAPQTPCRFKRFRLQLDPCCDYLVFETASAARSMVWSRLRRALKPYGTGILEQRVHHDRPAGRSQLVVKLHPHKGESLKRAALDMRLTPEIVIYIYSRRPTLNIQTRLKTPEGN
jgi:hypothetical protein